MTENELFEKIREWCDELGLWSYHPHNPLRDNKGWPDLVIIGSKVLYRELKSADGILSADQGEVGWLLKRAGQDWAVWWPMDLANGNIRAQLEAITPPR
jgi:hypothetical protein